jgi:2-phosphoglycolate phosphatase|tara:strand:- start:119 stop:832 length:714 start_codon:yes stop_codon:yes gene_type:complete
MIPLLIILLKLRVELISTVLFDLDGTFVDTAFDIIETANIVYKNNYKSEIPYEVGREIASDGVKAYLKLRFDEDKDDFDLLTEEFLTIYNQQFLNNPLLFDGIENLLLALEGNGVNWGIVTNKPRYFSENILKFHQLTERCSVLMCGDDDGFKPKPSPELLIEACRLLDENISDVIYVGDGHRDILSANTAKIKSVLACYGYLKKSDSIKDWHSDYIINSPSEIIDLDGLTFNNSLS